MRPFLVGLSAMLGVLSEAGLLCACSVLSGGADQVTCPSPDQVWSRRQHLHPYGIVSAFTWAGQPGDTVSTTIVMNAEPVS